MVTMKMLARRYFWWPGLDSDIGCEVKDCESCQRNANAPPSAPLHPWEWPSRPWSRLHVDYAGPFANHMFLVVGDAYSFQDQLKYNCSNCTKVERMLFNSWVAPDVIVSDNGTAFTSKDFALFMSEKGIKHITSAPKHPASNGFAERYVRTFKETMKKMVNEKGSLVKQIPAQFPHNSSGNHW